MFEAQPLTQFVLCKFQSCDHKVLVDGLTEAEFIRQTTDSLSFQLGSHNCVTSPKLLSHNCQRQASQSKSRELDRKKRSVHHTEWLLDTRAGARVGKGYIVSFLLLMITRRVGRRWSWVKSVSNSVDGGSMEKFPGNNMTWSVWENSRARLRYALGDSLDVELMYRICKERNCATWTGRSALRLDSFSKKFRCDADECIAVVVTRSEMGPTETINR